EDPKGSRGSCSRSVTTMFYPTAADAESRSVQGLDGGEENPVARGSDGRICDCAQPRLFIFHDRLTDDFIDGGQALVDRQQARVTQRAHAPLAGLDAKLLRAGVLNDHVAKVVVEGHDLEDAHPAAVAGVVAVVAPL